MRRVMSRQPEENRQLLPRFRHNLREPGMVTRARTADMNVRDWKKRV